MVQQRWAGSPLDQPVRFRIYWIRTLARHAAASPPLRRALIGVLNRVPTVKGRLKRALARANTLEAQRALGNDDIAVENVLLSRHARRTLTLLDQARKRYDARTDVEATRR